MSSCLVEVRGGGGGERRTGLELMDLLGPLLSCSNHMQLLLVGKSVYGCCTWLIETMSLTLFVYFTRAKSSAVCSGEMVCLELCHINVTRDRRQL